MKIGLQVNRFTWPDGDEKIGDTFGKVAVTAEQAGFYSLWVMDHFFQIHYNGAPEEPMLEGYTTLGFAAGKTKKIKLGTLVTGVIYRNPALLIKAVTTLDVLSNGRAYFGIGAAWNEEESNALGFDFPPTKTRFEMLEETLQLAHHMWEGNEKPFKGKHYNLPWPINHPQVLSKPHPPIMIGGGGEQKTLKFVAKYGDACNLFVRLGEEELTRKLDILKQHCKDVGRNYDEIEKTCLDQVTTQNGLLDEQGNVDAKKVVEVCKQMKKLGFTQLIFGIRNVETIKPLEQFGKDIIPEVLKF